MRGWSASRAGILRIWSQAALLLLAAALMSGEAGSARAAEQPPPADQPAAAPSANPAAPAAAPNATPAPPAPALTPAPGAPAAPPKAETAGTPATVIDSKQIESLLGKQVFSPTGEDMGRIVDVLLDKSGEVRAAVIDFGGFFGVGSRKIAVDWHVLHLKSEGKEDRIVADLPRNQLKTAPVYKEGEPVVVIGRATIEGKPMESPPAPAPANAAAPASAPATPKAAAPTSEPSKPE